MADNEIIITFPEATPDAKNICAASLSDELKDVHRSIRGNRRKEQADTMDFGATLVLVLGTAAATEVAKGIAKWIARHKTKIQLTVGGNSLTISDSDPASTARVIEALSAKP
jgi:acyl-CoA reductase-like NAD-dependent aldehyde dehydrogenase